MQKVSRQIQQDGLEVRFKEKSSLNFQILEKSRCLISDRGEIFIGQKEKIEDHESLINLKENRQLEQRYDEYSLSKRLPKFPKSQK
ncbi:hypothetical protein FGO68_gene16882 [Halteria grandinella]|uniref:Uncharacterized protein n=1 Tax=Halteria grandinella TaxID=5974 RepID=A0A8J8T7E8_HALGN|nr:hypothetical protein FGO68_gene16882 [Halteria grandinella]